MARLTIPDLTDLITSGEAAALTGYNRNTIIGWVRSGLLVPVGTAGSVRLLRRGDVLAVAEKQSQHPVGGPKSKKERQLILPGV